MTDSPPDEAWGFEWGTADGDGGFARLAFHRSERLAWFWAYLLRPGTGPVVVRDHEVTLPRGRALEIRADALWCELVCETPGEHWSIGLEAFGVGLDHPSDALGDEIGERIALGFDFEWETAGEAFVSDLGGVVREQQPGVVHGEVLLGRDRFPLDTVGHFEHSTGPADQIVDLRRSTTAWDDGSWDVSVSTGAARVGARWYDGAVVESGAAEVPDVDLPVTCAVRSVATIRYGDIRVIRGLGAVTDHDRRGTGWMESISDTRAKIT
jgi:hypothetical protein